MTTRIILLLLTAALPLRAGAQTFATPTFGNTTFGTQTSTSARPTFTPAPMPDNDLYAPLPPTPPANTAEISPQLIYPHKQYRGDGFSPGSTSQGVQERLLKPAPGISLKVPLD